MALSHKFKNSNDFLQGGEWFDDDHKICEWDWDASAKKLNIKCGVHGKKLI